MIKTVRGSDQELVGADKLIPPLEGLDREQLRQTVYRRVFGDADPVKVGRYTVLERIGRGGMGVVFKGYDTQLDRKVAVKVIHAGATDRLLIHEAKALARLSSPNVVQVYEVGHARDGELFIAMEFIDGPTLRAWLGARTRTWAEILDACIEAGEGLAAAHRAGLVHRDFKPENVMVGADGRTRVLDFGLARAHTADPSEAARRERLESLVTTLDGRNGVAGTPAYMAPEQLVGGTLGPATDQFAFCATVFEALYGVRPFLRHSLSELVAAIEDGNVQVPPGRGGVPRSVHRILLRGLHADPDRRYPSMRVLLSELRITRRSRQRRLWIAGLAAFAGIAVVGTWTGAERLGIDRALADAAASVQGYHEEMEILLTAEARLDSDPTAAIEALARLPTDSKVWDEPRTRVLVEQAEAWGLAERQLEIDPSLSVVGLAGDHVLLMRAAEDELIAVDTRAGASAVKIQLPKDPSFNAVVWGLAQTEASPTGRYVVKPGMHDTTVADLVTGTHFTLEGSGRAMEFSSDGEMLALRIGAETTVLRLVDGAPLLSVPHAVGPLALDDTGSRLAVGDRDGVVRVFDVATGEQRAIETRAQELAFIPGSRDLLVAGPGIYRWNTDARTRQPLAAENEMYRALAVSADGARAVASSDEGVRIVELTTGKLRRWDDKEGGLLSADGRWLAFTDEAGRAHVVDLDSGFERLLRHATPIRALAFGSGAVLTRGSDRAVRRWALTPGPSGLRGHELEVGGLAFSPDGEVLFSGGLDRTLRRWDLATGASAVLGQDVGQIGSVVVSHDGRHIASRTTGHTLTVREARGGAVVGEAHARSFGFLPDGDLVISAVDGLLRWDLASGTQRSILAELADCGAFAISPAGERLVASCEREGGPRRAVLWSIATGDVVAEADLGDYDSFSFTGSESQIVARNFLDPPLVHDFETGRTWLHDTDPRALIEAATDPMSFVARGASGGFLARGRSGAMIELPRSENSPIGVKVAVSADGRRMAATAAPGMILVRDRPAPIEADALRDWVREHVVVHEAAP